MGTPIVPKAKRRVLSGLLVIGIVAVALIIIGIAIQGVLSKKNRSLLNNPVTANQQTTTIANDTSQVTSTPENEKATISVVSTMSAFPFVQRWSAQYNNDENAAASLLVRYVDEDDAAKTASEGIVPIVGQFTSSNFTYIPLSAQAVAIVYNVPGLPDILSGLKLNATTLSKILNGTIT